MKKEFRTYFLKQRKSLPIALHAIYSSQMCDHLLNTDIWKRYTDIILYYPFNAEIDVMYLAQQAWNAGKRVYLPVIDEAENCFKPILFSCDTQLKDGKYGIKEPIQKPGLNTFEDSSQVLCIVPLLACDIHGFRLGYGGGYYDKYFALNPEIFRCAVGFVFQKYHNDLPRDHHDIAMMAFCSEEGIELF